jgi:hypothetical protein
MSPTTPRGALPEGKHGLARDAAKARSYYETGCECGH